MAAPDIARLEKLKAEMLAASDEVMRLDVECRNAHLGPIQTALDSIGSFQGAADGSSLKGTPTGDAAIAVLKAEAGPSGKSPDGSLAGLVKRCDPGDVADWHLAQTFWFQIHKRVEALGDGGLRGASSQVKKTLKSGEAAAKAWKALDKQRDDARAKYLKVNSEYRACIDALKLHGMQAGLAAAASSSGGRTDKAVGLARVMTVEDYKKYFAPSLAGLKSTDAKTWPVIGKPQGYAFYGFSKDTPQSATAQQMIERLSIQYGGYYRKHLTSLHFRVSGDFNTAKDVRPPPATPAEWFKYLGNFQGDWNHYMGQVTTKGGARERLAKKTNPLEVQFTKAALHPWVADAKSPLDAKQKELLDPKKSPELKSLLLGASQKQLKGLVDDDTLKGIRELQREAGRELDKKRRGLPYDESKFLTVEKLIAKRKEELLKISAPGTVGLQDVSIRAKHTLSELVAIQNELRAAKNAADTVAAKDKLRKLEQARKLTPPKKAGGYEVRTQPITQEWEAPHAPARPRGKSQNEVYYTGPSANVGSKKSRSGREMLPGDVALDVAVRPAGEHKLTGGGPASVSGQVSVTAALRGGTKMAPRTGQSQAAMASSRMLRDLFETAMPGVGGKIAGAAAGPIGGQVKGLYYHVGIEPFLKNAAAENMAERIKRRLTPSTALDPIASITSSKIFAAKQARKTQLHPIIANAQKAKGFYKRFKAGLDKLLPAVKSAEAKAGKDAVGAALAALDAALGRAQGANINDAAAYAMQVGSALGGLAKAANNKAIVRLQQALQDRMSQISAAAAGVPAGALQQPASWDEALAAYQGQRALERLSKTSPALQKLLGDKNANAALDALAKSVPGGLSALLSGKVSAKDASRLPAEIQKLIGAGGGVLGGGKLKGSIFSAAGKGAAHHFAPKYNSLAEALSKKRPSWATASGKAAALHILAGLVGKGQELRLQHALPHLLPGTASKMLQALGVFMGVPVHKGLWDRIKGAASSAASSVSSAVATGWSAAKKVAAPAMKIAQAVGNGVTNAAKTLSSAVAAKASQIATATANLGKKAGSLGKAAMQAYANGVSGIHNAVKNVANTAWTKAKGVASSAINVVSSTVKKGANALAASAGSAWQNAKSALAVVGQKVKGGLSSAWDKAKVVGGAIGKTAWKAFSYTPLGLAVKYAGPLVKAGMAKMAPTLSKWKNGLAEFGKKAWSGIKTVGKGIANFAQSPIGQMVITGLSIAANFIPGGPLVKGAIGFVIGTVSALASGADWKKALLAGGLGALEAIVPVAKLGMLAKGAVHAGIGGLQAAAEGGDWKDILKGAGASALGAVGGDVLKKLGGGKGVKMLQKFATGKAAAPPGLGKLQKLLTAPGGQKLVGGITKIGQKTVKVSLKTYGVLGKTHGVLEKVTKYGGTAKSALELVNELAEAGSEQLGGDNSLLGKALGKVAGWSGAGKDLLDKGMEKAEWADGYVMKAHSYLGAGLKFVGVNPEKALAKMEKQRLKSGKKSAMEQLREKIAGNSTVQKLQNLQQKIVDSKLSKALQKGYGTGLKYAVRIEGGLGKLQEKLAWAMEKGEAVDGILAQIDKLAEQGQDLAGDGRMGGALGKLRGWVGKGREGVAYGMEKAGWLDEKAGTVKGYLGRGLDIVGADREAILAQIEKEKSRRTKKNALEKIADKLKAKVNATRGKLADVAKRFGESKLGKALAKTGQGAVQLGAWTHDKLARTQELLAYGIAGGEKLEKTLAQIAAMARDGSELLGDSKWGDLLAKVGARAEDWHGMVEGGLEKVRKVNEMAGTASGALEQIYAMGGRDLGAEYGERRENEEKERSTWRHKLSDRISGVMDKLAESSAGRRARGALDKLGAWRDKAIEKGSKALDKIRGWRDKIAGGGVWVHGKLANAEKYLGKGIKFGKKVDSVLEQIHDAAEAGADQFEGGWLGGALAKLAAWAGKGDEYLDKGIAGAKKVKGSVSTGRKWLEAGLKYLGVDLGGGEDGPKKKKKRPLEELADPAEREFAEAAEGRDPASDDKPLDAGGPRVVGGPRGKIRPTVGGGTMYDPDELALLGGMEQAGQSDAQAGLGGQVGIHLPGGLDTGVPGGGKPGAGAPMGEMPGPLHNAALAIENFEVSVASAVMQAQKAIQDGDPEGAKSLLTWLGSLQKDIAVLLADAEPQIAGYANGALWMTHLRQRFARAKLRALMFTMAAEGVGAGLYEGDQEAMKDPRVQSLSGLIAEMEAKIQVFVSGGADANIDEQKASMNANQSYLRGQLEAMLADASPAVQQWAAAALRRLGSLGAVFADLVGGSKPGTKPEDDKPSGKPTDEQHAEEQEAAGEADEEEAAGGGGKPEGKPTETPGTNVLQDAAFAKEPGGPEDTWIGAGEAALPIGELLAMWATRKMRTDGAVEGAGDGPKVADEPELAAGADEALGSETPAKPPKSKRKKITPEKKSWFGDILEKAGDFVSGIANKIKQGASWFQKLMKKVSGIAGKVQGFTMKWAKKGGLFSGILKKVSAGAGWVKNFTGKLAGGAGQVKGVASTAEKMANKVEKFGKNISKKGFFGAVGALFKRGRTGAGTLGAGAPPRVNAGAYADEPARLDATVSSRMERYLGGKFGEVKIHTGPGAAQITQRYEAEAVTIKEHIFFAPGRFNPHTQEGSRLLAHELTHVLQRGRPNLSTREAESEAMHSEMHYHGDMHTLDNKPLSQDWVMAPDAAQAGVMTARKDRHKPGAAGGDHAEAEGEDLIDLLGDRVYDILLEDLENEIEAR